MWVVAQLVEHRTVTAGVEGSSPFDPPNFARNCGRGVRHLIVDQADDGSSPFSSANLLIDLTGCGVTQASESWELVVTVQLCPPRPNAFAPVAQLEEHDASNVEAAGPSPARSPNSSHPRTSAGRPARIRGSDVAGNMRVFQTRLESSNLSFRSNLLRASPSG